MRHFIHTMRSLGALSLLVGCASVHPIPPALQKANVAFSTAVQHDGTTLAPVELHAAKLALDAASDAYAKDPKAPDLADLAYIAQRKAEYAEIIAHVQKSNQTVASSKKALSSERTEAMANAQQDAVSLRQQLKAAQADSQKTTEQLTSLQNASVRQDARGTVISISGNVLFAPGKSELLPASRGQLNEIARILASSKAVQNISIEGFTDSTGSDGRNAQVSVERAEAVRTYLANKGVIANTMQTVGRGSTSPIASNSTMEGRASNRRVEIVVQGQASAQR